MIADRRELYNDQVYRYNTRIAPGPGRAPGAALRLAAARVLRGRPGRATRPDDGPPVGMTSPTDPMPRAGAARLARPPRRDRVGASRPPHRPDRHPADRHGPRAGARARPAAGRPPVRARPDQPAVARGRDGRARRLRRRRVVDPDLREWDYGALEGRLTADIREDYPGWTIWTGPWPDGETVDEVGARADRVARAGSAPPTATSWSSAHGHLLRVLAARWLGLPPASGGAVRARHRDRLDPRLGAREPGHRDLERGLPPRLTRGPSPSFPTRRRPRSREPPSPGHVAAAAGWRPSSRHRRWDLGLEQVVASQTALDDIRGRPATGRLDGLDQPVVAEPLAVGGLGVGHAVGVEQDEVARRQRDRRTRRDPARRTPQERPGAFQPGSAAVAGGRAAAARGRRSPAAAARSQVDGRAQGRDEQRRAPLLDEDPVGPFERVRRSAA